VSTFRVHLWKEWREHRLVLLVLALLVPAAVLGAAAFAEARVLGNAVVPAVCALFAGLALTMTVGGDSLAREEGARLAFLERLPGGLAAAFRAKLTFFAAALLALETVAVLAALAAALWRCGELADGWIEPVRGWSLAGLYVATLTLGLWPLAAGAWSPNGSLSTPLAALTLGALAWPCWVLPVLGYGPSTEQVLLAVLGLLAGGLLASALGFVRGRARGGTRAGAAARALGAAALLAVPGSAWGAHELWLREHLDPTAPSFQLDRVEVGESGRVAFVTGHHELRGWDAYRPYSLIVDLEDGGWREVGGRQAYYFAPVPSLDEAALAAWPDVASEFVLYGTEGILARFDGEGRELHGETRWPIARWSKPVGLGYRDDPRRTGRIWDPIRRRVFRVQDVLPSGVVGNEILVSRAGWLVREREGWRLLDPESGALRELAWPRGEQDVAPMLADGRVLLVADGELLLADARDGTLAHVSLPEGLAEQEYRYVQGAWSWGRPLRSDRPLFLRWGFSLLELDPAARTTRLVPELGDADLLGLAQDGALLLGAENQIWRCDRASGEERVLFPRPLEP